MNWSELNFTEICRCCKRKESGMTSIFDGNENSTYPPVKEMLISIASLKVQENDGLPSLVCASCLNNIQDAFTFILQLVLVDEELSKMLASRKLDSLLKATCDTYQLSTHSVKKGNKSAPEQAAAKFPNILKQNSTLTKQASATVHHNTNDAAENIVEPKVKKEEASANKRRKTTSRLALVPDERKESSTCNDLQMVQKAEVMEDFEVFQILVEVDEEMEEYGICQKSRAKRQATTSNAPADKLYKCNLCTYTTLNIFNIRQHLQTHCKDKPFACSKCNSTFARKGNMLSHMQTCNGYARAKSIRVINRQLDTVTPLTLQDLKNPLTIKKYYTVVSSL